jgi:hypothetical protein
MLRRRNRADYTFGGEKPNTGDIRGGATACDQAADAEGVRKTV